MIRAVLFDFYSVWLPDIFKIYLDQAKPRGTIVVGELETVINQYFHGQVGIEEVAGNFRYKLSRPDIDTSEFFVDERSISPGVADFMRELHGHFLKLGVLANLGQQEYKVLSDFNARNQLFEVIGSPLSFQLAAPLLSQDVFARTLQILGEPPQNCLVVSGDPAYQNFAAGLGMPVIAFAGFPALRQELNQRISTDLK